MNGRIQYSISGKRMQSDVKKQYIEIDKRPLIYYALDTFEKSEIITDVILVTGADDIEYCRKEIVERFSFSKVSSIVCGGREIPIEPGDSWFSPK